MSIGRFLVHFSLLLFVLAGVVSGHSLASSSVPDHAAVIHHDLVVELSPATHELVARDRTEVVLPRQVASVSFTLAPTLHVESIVLKERPEEPLPFTRGQVSGLPGQRIIVALPADHETRVSLQWNYRGVIDDPPREPRHLRFVTPSETSGHIGQEGVYLSSESQWYPDIEGSLSTYRVLAYAPQDWTVVTQGMKQEERTSDGRASSTWDVRIRSEALTLVANRFVTKSREWKGPNGQQVELATYFFPDNAELADEYLIATAQYLDAYVPLLGDYPFEKFAVVENFFASGLGMPSLTLLGSGSIKRHYVQPYALGHEIVHSWIGNSVLNRTDQGNWVEGLTTYLANYYWHELARDARQAMEQRRLMLQTFSVYVAPERDYPVAHFQRKSDERDNAIGYQKSAFVFHLLRQEVGDEVFFRGLRSLTSRYRDRYADWHTIEALFSGESRQDLRWFFEQWVEQPGAPSLSLGEASARRMAGGAEDVWRLTVRVEQAGKPFRMAVPVKIVTKGGAETKWVILHRSSDTITELIFPQQPVQITLDPDLMVFRRFARTQLPPMLNSYVTDSHRTVLRAFADPASPLEQVVTRVADQESRLPEFRRTQVLPVKGSELPPRGSVLVLAEPDQLRPIQSIVTESCGDLVRLGSTGVHLDGQAHEGPNVAVLFSCHRANVPGSVVTVLYGVTPQAVANVSRLLFYYGWQSYVIFREGSVAKRGLWQLAPDLKEVRIDADR
jgi:hypothetical protein